MRSSVIVRGDVLPQYAELASECGDPQRPTGLLWGVDLHACASRKEAKTEWRKAVAGIRAALDEFPSVRRVCVAGRRPDDSSRPLAPVKRVPGGLALQIHNDLERDRGRFVQTLVLDVTGCDQPKKLTDRLAETFDARSTGWSDLTLTWNDISDRGCEQAWEAQAL